MNTIKKRSDYFKRKVKKNLQFEFEFDKILILFLIVNIPLKIVIGVFFLLAQRTIISHRKKTYHFHVKN